MKKIIWLALVVSLIATSSIRAFSWGVDFKPVHIYNLSDSRVKIDINYVGDLVCHPYSSELPPRDVLYKTKGLCHPERAEILGLDGNLKGDFITVTNPWSWNSGWWDLLIIPEGDGFIIKAPTRDVLDTLDERSLMIYSELLLKVTD